MTEGNEPRTMFPCLAMPINVSRVDNRSKSRASNRVDRNISETSGNRLARIPKLLVTLLQSASRGAALKPDGPGWSEELLGRAEIVD